MQQGPSHVTIGLIFLFHVVSLESTQSGFNNINWSVCRVLHEANTIDKAYCMAIKEDPVTHITPQPMPSCLHISVGPRIFLWCLCRQTRCHHAKPNRHWDFHSQNPCKKCFLCIFFPGSNSPDFGALGGCNSRPPFSVPSWLWHSTCRKQLSVLTIRC